MSGVYLVGFMGCGKTAAGSALAAILGVQFIDLDAVISTRLEATVAEIFAARGEAVFRREETEVLRWATGLDRPVVATGGGTFCSPVNRDLIHASGGLSVFLDIPWEVVLRRLPGKNGDRPLFADAGRARRLFDERLPAYRSARIVLHLTGDEAPVEVARQVVAALPEGVCAT